MLGIDLGIEVSQEEFLIGAIILGVAFSVFSTTRRHMTLRREPDGSYTWTEWHGGRRSSDTDPSAPGGDWDSDGDGGDGGD